MMGMHLGGGRIIEEAAVEQHHCCWVMIFTSYPPIDISHHCFIIQIQPVFMVLRLYEIRDNEL